MGPISRAGRLGGSLATLAGLLVACGGGDSAACTGVEEIMEASSGHVIRPEAARYQHHPPTSGTHMEREVEAGVREEPLPEAVQVGALHEGFVFLHYEDTVGSDEQAELAAVAEGNAHVVVTPADVAIDGDDHRVAFTAWGHRQRCTAVSVDAAREFVERFAGRGVRGAQ